ncbi:hypothetical protein LEP1GSC172_2829 [Leptospira noguchii]|uniref:Uncharacterized protein n=1 Tax=Leptospira noguchii TaxID=28182 RepID=M6VCZ0_9LEPT|nr:hypothetical protein LEP1GSC172_2829 [Leptospira noguchii]
MLLLALEVIQQTPLYGSVFRFWDKFKIGSIEIFGLECLFQMNSFEVT